MGKWKIVLSVFALLRDSFWITKYFTIFLLLLSIRKKIIDFLFFKKKKAGLIASNY